MMKQKDVDKKGSYWSDLWGNPKENQSSGKRIGKSKLIA
jgi:hypothetical protein